MPRSKTIKSENIVIPESITNKSIAKEFGDGVIINGTSILDNPKEVISVCPSIDSALGGGLQVGSLVTMAGKYRTGKTTTALHFAAKWQALGRKVVYLNAEHRLERRDLKGIPGLRPEEFTIIQSRRGKILTAQDFFSIAFSYLSQETDLLVIIDSISILSEEREVTGGMGTETRGGSARLLSQFCRLTTPVIPVNGHILIGIAHLYANTSGQGKKWLVAMGNKAQYALATSLYAEKSEPWYVGSDQDKRLVGQINHWKVERTPLDHPPNEEAKSYLRYGSGIDETQEYLKFAEDLRLIENNGSWYYYPSKEEAIIKGQGEEKFRQMIMADEKVFEKVKSRVQELMS